MTAFYGKVDISQQIETGLTSEHELINSLADEGHSRIGIANTVEKMKKECIYTEKKGGFLKRL